MSNSRNVLEVLVAIFALVMKIPPILKWFMEGWAGNGIYGFRTTETISHDATAMSAESGCLSDDCCSGTRCPIAGNALGAPGPGSALAASHFPASVYDWVIWGQPTTCVWRGAYIHTSALQQSTPSPRRGRLPLRVPGSWCNACPASHAPPWAAPSRQEDDVRGARTAKAQVVWSTALPC